MYRCTGRSTSIFNLLGGATTSLTELFLELAAPVPPTMEDSLVVLARDWLEEVEGGAREFPWVEGGPEGEASGMSESIDWECRTVVVWWGLSPVSSYEIRRVGARDDWAGV